MKHLIAWWNDGSEDIYLLQDETMEIMTFDTEEQAIAAGHKSGKDNFVITNIWECFDKGWLKKPEITPELLAKYKAKYPKGAFPIFPEMLEELKQKLNSVDKDLILFVYPNQKSVTIRCPKCKAVVKRFRRSFVVTDCTDSDTCKECHHQFGWRVSLFTKER